MLRTPDARPDDERARARDHRAQRPGAGAAHRGPARRVPHHHRQAAARRAPGRRSRRVRRGAVESVRPAADAKGVRARRRRRRRAPARCVGDADRLQQIVWNLLSNAVKFTPRGGRVEVRLAGDGERASRSPVADTGAGHRADVPPARLRALPAGRRSDTRKHGGLGLGLAIVKHLVELHGGTITAESDGAGRGATFTVRLPCARADRGLAGGRWVADPETEVPRRPMACACSSSTTSPTRASWCGRARGGRRASSAASRGRGAASLRAAPRRARERHRDARRGRLRADPAGARPRPRAARQVPAVALTAYARARTRIRPRSPGSSCTWRSPSSLRG